MIGRITLVGAGELMPAMSALHRTSLRRMAAPRPVFLDTPAGFETNVDGIVAKAIEYYARYLQTELRVASYRHGERTPLAQTAAAVAEVRAANLIFAGPGSPTYAIKQWRQSPVWDAVMEAFRSGAELLFASAASIALGRYALPVYEIYKAGEDPFWAEGLDLLGCLGLRVAVVPHFDDHSGGESYDTRFCYMGKPRFDALRAQLPPDVAVLGIDAYTAVCLDAAAQKATVTGKGGMTLISGGEEVRYTAGSTLPLTALRAGGADPPPNAAVVDAPPEPEGGLAALIEASAALTSAEKIELLARLQALQEQAPAQPAANEGSLVDLILELRQGLREAKRFDLADRARDVLGELGFEVGDTPEGARWTRR